MNDAAISGADAQRKVSESRFWKTGFDFGHEN
jgi:hypothetical protein